MHVGSLWSPRAGSDDLGSTAHDIGTSARSMWETFVTALPRVGVAVGMVVLGWAASRGVRWAMRRLWSGRQTPSFAEVMSKLTGWVFLAVVVLLAIAVTFPSVRPVDVLAGLGFFSVAIGFAFQDILENTLSGVLLLFRQPFRSGDQIEVQQRTGTVQAITIRETQIRTFDGQLLIIPNRDVYKSAIRVQTAFDRRRAEFVVGISPDTDVEAACSVIEATAAAIDGVAGAPSPTAMVSSIGAKVVEITVWFWTVPDQFDATEARHRVMVEVLRALGTAGVELPADTVAVQATPSLAAALRGDDALRESLRARARDRQHDRSDRDPDDERRQEQRQR